MDLSFERESKKPGVVSGGRVILVTTEVSSFSWAPTTVGACKNMQATRVQEMNDGLCRFILIVLVGQMMGS